MQVSVPRTTAFIILIAASGVTGCVDTSPPELSPQRASMERIEADVRVRSDNLLEEREAGMRGYDLAALYVAEQFRTIGLKLARE